MLSIPQKAINELLERKKLAILLKLAVFLNKDVLRNMLYLVSDNIIKKWTQCYRNWDLFSQTKCYHYCNCCAIFSDILSSLPYEKGLYRFYIGPLNPFSVLLLLDFLNRKALFGEVKEDMNFRRFFCREKRNLLAASILLGLAHNVNKLHNKIQNGRCGSYLHPLKTA